MSIQYQERDGSVHYSPQGLEIHFFKCLLKNSYELKTTGVLINKLMINKVDAMDGKLSNMKTDENSYKRHMH